TNVAIDAMFRMQPCPRSSIGPPNTWQARRVPVRFTSMIESQISSVHSSVGMRRVVPAELTRISTLPNSVSTASRSRTSVARSVTSDATRRVRRPTASISAATESTPLWARDVATTSAPAAARPSDNARPMPSVPPTTTAVFPVSDKSTQMTQSVNTFLRSQGILDCVAKYIYYIFYPALSIRQGLPKAQIAEFVGC